MSDLYNEQVFIACKLTRKNTHRLISCKNKEKLPLENLVSANMKLFGRIYVVTETDGNTEKQVRLPDRIFHVSASRTNEITGFRYGISRFRNINTR